MTIICGDGLIFGTFEGNIKYCSLKLIPMITVIIIMIMITMKIIIIIMIIRIIVIMILYKDINIILFKYYYKEKRNSIMKLY